MKKTILLLISISISSLGFAQGINFFHGTFEEAVNQAKSENKLLFIDCYTAWCGPCKILGPILKEVKDNFGERISIIKIDVDKNRSITSQYQVRGVPTMLLFQNGKQLWRQSGVLSKIEIVTIINEKCTWT